MDHGRIDQIGSPDQIFATPASRFVARFVGDNNIAFFAFQFLSKRQQGKDILK